MRESFIYATAAERHPGTGPRPESFLIAAAAMLTARADSADTSEPVDPVGKWENPSATAEPSLELASDGQGVAITFMACAGVDQWLNGLASAKLDGDTLTIQNTDGTEISTLPRSA